jgi:hypothetical protein
LLGSHAPLSWATSLLSESLALSERQLDILVTLGTNMSMTRLALRDDMGILAQAFEEFAPTRKFEFSGRQPELASAMLRRLIKG